jgi:hypothetical protein
MFGKRYGKSLWHAISNGRKNAKEFTHMPENYKKITNEFVG